MLGRHDALEEVYVQVGGMELHGSLGVPQGPVGLVIFAGTRDPYVAEALRARGLATLVVGLELDDSERYDIELLASRLASITDWMMEYSSVSHLPVGYFGAGTGAAVVLAAAGIYGVMTYTISQRAQEFGIRLALGASAKDIVQLVSAEGLRLTAIGTFVGLAGAWAASQLLAELLYDVAPTNPIILASAAGLLALTAIVACVLPTLRAVRVDPLTSLRSQ